MDALALASHRRAIAARAEGFWRHEISPYPKADGTVVADDDCPRPDTSLAALAALKPVLPDRPASHGGAAGREGDGGAGVARSAAHGPGSGLDHGKGDEERRPAGRRGGRVTAGNTTVAGDGAAALVVTSGRRAAELGLTPLARVTATAVSGLAPEVMGMGPVEATRRALAKANLGIGDVDVVECHENFAAQVIPVCRELGIDMEHQLNPFGGSLALGHPSGMTGARLVVTLLNDLRALDATLGLATTCAAGGQGLTLLLERLA